MRVQDIMTTGVQTVSPTTAAETAWELMRTKGFHHLVVTRGSEIVGVLSDRDAGGRGGAAVRANRTVADLMTERVVTADPAMTMRRAANLMRGRSIGCLVVADSGRVVGIVTVADVLELLGRGVERPVVRGQRWTLTHRPPRRKHHGAVYGV
jgi:acetoin utilization protein AcuB